VMLLNAGFDPIPDATVHLRVPACHARLLAIGRRVRPPDVQPEATGVRIALRGIEPWGLRMLLLEGV